MSENKDIEETVEATANTEAETVVSEEKAADNQGDTDMHTEIERLKEEVAALELKASENHDLALRAKAEAENTRRRVEKDVANAHKFALEKFAQDLLPIIDSMEMGIGAATDENASVEKIREGSELTFKMFTSALEKHGIQPVDPQGEKFNPDLHQAMSMQENPDVPPNTVMAVMQKGYTLQGRLVRPAMVMVSKGGAPKPESGSIDEMA
ncbi:MAG: nucleotide exchange factor GrpE [Gammaproteobacteria bacterium]|nr:nucleotide exchange factor GrpE [Gammaproteobacteria bacterium]